MLLLVPAVDPAVYLNRPACPPDWEDVPQREAGDEILDVEFDVGLEVILTGPGVGPEVGVPDLGCEVGPLVHLANHVEVAAEIAAPGGRKHVVQKRGCDAAKPLGRLPYAEQVLLALCYPEVEDLERV